MIAIIALLIGVILGLSITNVHAADRPLPYTISNPHITIKNKSVLIEWRQTQKVLVMVYKVSYTRKLNNNCGDLETFGANCTIIWQKTNLTGNIRITDKNYKKGDEYYIQQNVYLTHNGGYGPFIPK